MAAFLLFDATGGMSDEPPQTLGPTQVEIAQNVHFWKAPLGARRNGSVLLASGMINAQYVAGPQPNQQNVWTVDSGGNVTQWNASMARTTITLSPADTLNMNARQHGQFLPAHSKMFLALPSNVIRGHVWVSGTTMRRSGLATTTNAPTATDTAGAGTFTGTRYYRYRLIEQPGSTILRRSEPSAVLTFTPSGTKTGAIVSLNGVAGEGETHWEVEESINNSDFYRIATVAIGTTTYTDTLANTAIALNGVLSADIGDYTLPPNARLLVLDHDRVLMIGAWETAASDCDVTWTPPGNDPTGVGNDERIVSKYTPTLRLNADGPANAPTCAVRFDSRVVVFCPQGIYDLYYTGANVGAYVSQTVSTQYGAMYRSLIEAPDHAGNPSLYFVDPMVGPCRRSGDGIQQIAMQLQDRFVQTVDRSTFNVFTGTATLLQATGMQAFYNADQREVYWHMPLLTGGMQRWVYNTVTGGWSIHTLPGVGVVHSLAPVSWPVLSGAANRAVAFGVISSALPSGAYGAYLVNAPGAQNDCGETFRAYVRSRAFAPGQLLKRSETRGVVFEGTSASGATVGLSLIRNYGVEQTTPVAFTLASGTYSINPLDNVRLAEATSVQLEWGDASAVSSPIWRLIRLAANETVGGDNV